MTPRMDYVFESVVWWELLFICCVEFCTLEYGERRIQNSVEHLQWSFFAEKVNGKEALLQMFD